MRRLLQTVALLALAVWWIWFILWQPGLVGLIQNITYRYTAAPQPAGIVVTATNRALEYSTRGTAQTQGDIYFTAAEIAHLNDVAHLYQMVRIGSALCAVVGVSYLIVARSFRILERRSFLLAAYILCGFGILVALAIIGFTIFFISFHELAFPQGNWAFPADSLLIQLFPELFWRLMTGSILLLTTLMASLYWLIYHFLYE